MKILYTTTVGATMTFFYNFINKLINEGDAIDIATNEQSMAMSQKVKDLHCKTFPIIWDRNPLSFGNIIVIKQLKRLITENHYDIVHCHTPIAAACTRIACKSLRKKGLKVIYTAHGFHFYKGAPILNWLIYYPIEKICSYWTDELITINREDYELAKKKLKAKNIHYVPGVGIDVAKFADASVDKTEKRREINVPSDAFIILSVGELNTNKNHQIIMKAIAELTNIHYVIAGEGANRENLEKLAENLGMKDRLHLLGQRTDVEELYKIADIYALPSIREGLNVSVMEALASGTPCMVSKIRGNTDMVDENCGWLFNPMSVDDVKTAIHKAMTEDIAAKGENAAKKAKMFEVNDINQIIKEIYNAEVVATTV